MPWARDHVPRGRSRGGARRRGSRGAPSVPSVPLLPAPASPALASLTGTHMTLSLKGTARTAEGSPSALVRAAHMGARIRTTLHLPNRSYVRSQPPGHAVRTSTTPRRGIHSENVPYMSDRGHTGPGLHGAIQGCSMSRTFVPSGATFQALVWDGDMRRRLPASSGSSTSPRHGRSGRAGLRLATNWSNPSRLPARHRARRGPGPPRTGQTSEPGMAARDTDWVEASPSLARSWARHLNPKRPTAARPFLAGR